MRELVALRILAAMGLAASAGLVAGLLVLTGRIDGEQRRREMTLVSEQVDSNLAEARASAITAATSDEAIRHLDHARDADWARNAYVDPAGGALWIYTLDRDGALTSGGHAPRREMPFERELPGRVAALRRTPGMRIVPGRPPEGHAASEVFWSDRRCFVLLAATFMPATDAVRLVHEVPPILAAVTPLDAFLSSSLRGAGIQGLGILPNKVAGGATKTLVNADGGVAATITWRPARPGLAMLRIILPPLVLLISLFLILVAFTYRRGVVAARHLVASEARAQHAACHDPLTGLANRRLFMERLERMIVRNRQDGTHCMVLLVDLDRFKNINDIHGHQGGDELLAEMGRRLKAVCRAGDLCARLGGDEFIIAAADRDPQDAASLPRRILGVFSEPVRLSVNRVQVAGSVGASILRDGVGMEELIAEADLALYKSKENGRGQFHLFEPSISLAIAQRQRLKTDLHAALLNDGLEVHYQPQFRDGQIVGLEALARWSHPEHDSIAPGHFIPLAEESGLIDQLGIQVIRRAFRDRRRWPTLRVAINLSAVQLRMPGFLPGLEAAIREEGADPAGFEFELGQAVLLADDIQTSRAIVRLRDLGFSLAVDDLGVGHLNLGYLSRLPIDRIKIDRSFVVGLPDDRVLEAVVRAIVQIGRTLGLDVVAEGIETAAQQRHLATIGCESLQGFFLSRPGPADVIEALLAKAGPRGAGDHVPDESRRSGGTTETGDDPSVLTAWAAACGAA